LQRCSLLPLVARHPRITVAATPGTKCINDQNYAPFCSSVPTKVPTLFEWCFSGTSFAGLPTEPDAVRLRLRASGSCRPRSSILFRFGSSTLLRHLVHISRVCHCQCNNPQFGQDPGMEERRSGQTRPFRPPSKNASRREPDPARNPCGRGLLCACLLVACCRLGRGYCWVFKFAMDMKSDSVRGPLSPGSGASDLRVPASSPSVPDGARSEPGSLAPRLARMPSLAHHNPWSITIRMPASQINATLLNQETSVHDGTFQATSSTAVSDGSAYWSQMEPRDRSHPDSIRRSAR
jgi:hypothetical protein